MLRVIDTPRIIRIDISLTEAFFNIIQTPILSVVVNRQVCIAAFYSVQLKVNS